MPQVVICTSPNSDDYQGSCDCAVIDVTAELLEKLRRRITAAKALFEQESNSVEVRFLDWEAKYYPHEVIDACEVAGGEPWKAQVADTGMALLPPSINMDDYEQQPTKLDLLILKIGSQPAFQAWLKWTGYPDHTDTHISTCTVTLDELEKWLAE